MNNINHKRISYKILLIVFLFFTSMNIPSAKAENQSFKIEKKIKIFTKQIKRKYGITAIYKDIPKQSDHKYIYSEAEEKDLEKLYQYIKLFYQELSKYPKTFFQNKKLNSIVFVKKLFFNEKPAEGLFAYKDKRIFFDFSRNEKSILAKKHSIHHEFYHMMDIMQPGWRDPIWNTFNQEGFSYGEDYVHNSEKERGKRHQIFRERKGFMSPYSMKSAEEDKAEIYACLLIKSQNKILHKWINDDEILKKKTEYIKTRIKEFCSDMNQNYWNNLFSK